MHFLDALSPVLLGCAIFGLRIIDVSIGTVRTLVMVQGRRGLSVFLAFFEVLVWIIAVSQVVSRIDTMPWLAPFYAGGFAAGVGVGMTIERRLALGRYVIRLISKFHGTEIATALRGQGRVLGTFRGETNEGPANLIYVSARGNRIPAIIELAREADPDVLFVIESASAWSENVLPLPHPTGWRAVFKKK